MKKKSARFRFIVSSVSNASLIPFVILHCFTLKIRKVYLHGTSTWDLNLIKSLKERNYVSNVLDSLFDEVKGKGFIKFQAYFRFSNFTEMNR